MKHSYHNDQGNTHDTTATENNKGVPRIFGKRGYKKGPYKMICELDYKNLETIHPFHRVGMLTLNYSSHVKLHGAVSSTAGLCMIRTNGWTRNYREITGVSWHMKTMFQFSLFL